MPCCGALCIGVSIRCAHFLLLVLFAGKIEFWEFFAWQTYMVLQLGDMNDFAHWMHYVTQTHYTRLFDPRQAAADRLPQLQQQRLTT